MIDGRSALPGIDDYRQCNVTRPGLEGSMTCHRRLAALLGLVTLLASLATSAGSAAAQDARIVTASAHCVAAANGHVPEVEVTLTNRTGAPVTVGYVHGFTTPRVFAVLMRMEDPGETAAIVVADGATRTLRAPWDDLRWGADDFGGALVVTSAGALVPGCNDSSPRPAEIRLGPAPASADAARREAVTIAAQTLGQLESWRAYPALYRLLHPAARAEVPFAAMACWYATQYGFPASPRQTVFTTQIIDVTFSPWTWDVTGETFPQAATVSYRQRVGGIAQADEVERLEHLVAAGGQWRWFFGTSREAIGAQSTDCGLEPAADTVAAATTGSI